LRGFEGIGFFMKKTPAVIPFIETGRKRDKRIAGDYKDTRYSAET